MTHAFDVAAIPAQLKEAPRWLVWALDGSGKKAPRAAHHPSRSCDANKPNNWTDFETAKKSAIRQEPEQGIGFALGPVDNGPTYAGVDLDGCRNPETGVIERWAQNIIRCLNSYTEVSPSGTGVKVFVTGTLPDNAKQGKVYKVEVYDHDRYFTVTGKHVTGTPSSLHERSAELRELHATLWGGDIVTLATLFGFLIERKSDAEAWIRCPWEEHHSTPSKAGDCGVQLKDGVVTGFHCFHAGCSEKTIGHLLKFFGVKGKADEFKRTKAGHIVSNDVDNLRTAIDKLGYGLCFDKFAERVLVQHDHRVMPFADAIVTDIRMAINDQFGFLPPRELLYEVLEHTARQTAVHPVIDYFSSLQWDKTPRLDTWLITYGGAEDTEYNRHVGALPLLAAVRRVRQPGAKFDEMLVLESKQGTQKSTAIATLCPNPEWFSDDLALGLDSQEVIERTGGKWIIEAGELKGLRQSQVEPLKNFLSRSVDGPVRRAYGRIAEERLRQFVFIGTTNSGTYLRDSTGNRRYWPVKVKHFNVIGLRNDRDQLWAEAAAREAVGEPIRLPEHLWKMAGEEQEARRQEDPWEEAVTDAIGDNEVVAVASLWAVLGSLGATQSNNHHSSRLTDIMERLGYLKPRGGVRRINGKPTRCWIKATSPLLRTDDDEGAANPFLRPAFIKKVEAGR